MSSATPARAAKRPTDHDARIQAKRTLLARDWQPLAPVLTVLLAASDHCSAQGKPSFDCAKAASVAEKAICADPAPGASRCRCGEELCRAAEDARCSSRQGLAGRSERFHRISRPDRRLQREHAQGSADFRSRRIPARPRDLPCRHPQAGRSTGFIGTWSSVRGSVDIKAVGAGKLEISEDIVSNPVSGSGSCEIDGTVANRKPCGSSTPTTTTSQPVLSSPSAAMAMRLLSSRAAPARMTVRSRPHAAPTAMSMDILPE